LPAIRVRHRRFGRWWVTAAALTAVALVSVVFVAASGADSAGGCDFSPANNGTPGCLGPLTGSSFAGGDGNLQASPSNFGSVDWTNVAGLNHASDLPTGRNDNSLGQGTKEDDPNITVVTGSIPNNKSDLTRFYESSETGSNNHTFLYLGWERANVLGTANMDFEINHNATAGFNASTTGPVTLNRTAGDLLVTFDFTNGGGRPSVAILRWLTAAAGNTASQCFSANSLPCWGNRNQLDGTDSIAAVNNIGSVNDPLFPGEPNAQNPVPTNQFGETAIDLNKADVFKQGICEAFGSAFVKSRSSASFTSEAKDFIAPVPVNISNCGQIIIRKVTDPNPDPTDTTFSYTTTGGLTPSTFGLKNGQKQDYGSSVQQGSYSVTEADPGSNFALLSLDCSASKKTNGSTTSVVGATVSIVLKPNDVIDCTYTNQLHLGAIKINKTSIKGTALNGAVFSIKDANGNNVNGSPATTHGSGSLCIDGLPLGDYSVQETTAPAGYQIDDSTVHTVRVDNNAKCEDNPYVGETFSATDTPLTDIVAKAKSQATGGTASQVTCVNSDGDNVGNSPEPDSGFADPAEVDANGLVPGTYTCTIVIDP
jgi:Prealbumin-like fold domain